MPVRIRAPPAGRSAGRPLETVVGELHELNASLGAGAERVIANLTSVSPDALRWPEERQPVQQRLEQALALKKQGVFEKQGLAWEAWKSNTTSNVSLVNNATLR